MTEQQEFLEDLKNPRKARLRAAVKDFQQGYRNSIRAVHLTEQTHAPNYFSVEVIADNERILQATSKIFLNKIRRFMNDPITNIQTNTTAFDGLYRYTYYVTEAIND